VVHHHYIAKIMRILFATGIYPPDAGGPATYTRSLARALLSSGHNVQVVCYGERDEVDQTDGYSVQRIGRGANVLVRYWKFMLAVRRRAKDADMVYLQGPVSEGLPGTIGAWLAGKPTVMKVVGDYAWEIFMQGASGGELLDPFLTHPHSGKIRFLELIERWTSRRAKIVITPSAYLATVVQAWGVQKDCIRVIRNAAEPLPSGLSRDDARESFNVSNRSVMLTAVRCVPWKGADFILDLMSTFPKDVLFVVAGDGPMLQTWKDQAASLALGDRVRFLGRLDRSTLANWYRASDLFLLPTGYEGFPHVVPEAASVGLPSFVSDKGGNPETKDLLGEDLVRVLPYRDGSAWLNALSSPWPERTPGAVPDELRFETMVGKAVGVLKEIV
jgi:glycosyltransferase involved in cell wall biosynthesis